MRQKVWGLSVWVGKTGLWRAKRPNACDKLVAILVCDEFNFVTKALQRIGLKIVNPSLCDGLVTTIVTKNVRQKITIFL